MRQLLAMTVTMLLLAACSGSTPPVETEPPPEAPAPSAAPTGGIGVVRVTSNGLNVRRDPSMSAEVLMTVKKDERLALLANTGEWSRVQVADGRIGWVASRFVTRDDAPAEPAPRRRRGCPPDAEFRFVNAPKPRFSDLQSHGLVAVDVTVDAKGKITSTRVVSNTTGDDALAEAAVQEIRSATFSPPVRNCAPRAFIYTYKRSF